MQRADVYKNLKNILLDHIQIHEKGNFLYLSENFGSVLITCIDGDEETGVDCNGGNPAGPDEKSPDAPITISEEFLHIHHSPVNPDWINMFFQHKVHEAEKLCIFHPELFSPPPEA